MPDDDLEESWKDLKPTIGSLYGPAIEVRDEAAAKVLFERLVARAMAYGLTREAAERQERANIGYYAGYHSPEVWERVRRLFGVGIPFTSITTSFDIGNLPQKAFEAGQQAGRRLRSESPVFCEHANEMPSRCPCDPDCYCKSHSCRQDDRCRGCLSRVGEPHQPACSSHPQEFLVLPEHTRP